jgi:hypothetical protein
VEKYATREEEHPKVPLVTSSSGSVRTGFDDPDQVVAQVEETADDIPFGWTRIKLEPDW